MEHSNVFGAEPSSSGGGNANLSNYYTKAEVTAFLSNKANLSAGKLATGEVPDLAITNVVTVSNNGARDALTVEAGDVAIVSSTGLTWMWSGSAWVQIESTQVSWDNTVSSSGQTATAKFAAIDTALASAGSSVTVGNTVPSTSTTDALSANAIETNYLRKTNGNWQELGGMVGYNHTPNFNYANSTNVLVTRKYVDDNVGDMSFCGLSDVAPTTHSANKLTYSDGTNLNFTTNQIQINGSGIKTGQVNPVAHQSTNLGDSTNRWNNVHCRALNAGAELVLPTTAGTANQVLSTDGQGTLSWVSQSSGGGSYLPTSEVHTVYRANDASTTQTYDCSYINEGFLWHQARYLNKQTELHTVYRANNAQQYQTYDCSYINEGFLWHQARYDAKPDIDDTQVSSTTVFSSNKTNNDYLKKTHTLQQNLNGLLQYDGFTPSFSSANQLVTKGYVDAQSGASIDDSQLSSSTVYSSTKIDADYFPRSLVFNSTRSSQNETYGCAFLNTQLANKMSSTVTDAQNTGGKFYTESGGALTFKRLVGGTNVTVTENSTNITISAAGGSTADGVLNSASLSSAGVLVLGTSGGSSFNTTISSENIYWNVYSGTGDLPSASSKHGMFAHVHGTGKGYFAHAGNWVQLLDTGNLKTSSSNSATDVYSTSYIQTNFEPKLPTYSSGYLHYNGSTLTWSTPATGAGLPSSATPNHVLTWNGTSWVGQAVPTELPSSSTANYVLTWNGTSWVGQAVPSGVVSSVLTQYAASPGTSDVYNAGYINANNTLHNTRHTNLETKTQNVVTSAATHTEFTSTLNSVVTTVLRVGRPTSSDPYVQCLGSFKTQSLYFAYGGAQAGPVETPSTAGDVLTANANGTWSWQTPATGVVSSILTQYAASPGTSDVYNAGYINANNTLHNTRHTNLETKTQNVVTSAATHTEFTSTLNSVTSTVLRVGRPTSSDPYVQCLGSFKTQSLYFAYGGAQAGPVETPVTNTDKGKILCANGNSTWEWRNINLDIDNTDNTKTCFKTPITQGCTSPGVDFVDTGTVQNGSVVGKIFHGFNGSSADPTQRTDAAQTDVTQESTEGVNLENMVYGVTARRRGAMTKMVTFGSTQSGQSTVDYTKYTSVATTNDIEIGRIANSVSTAGLIFRDGSKQNYAVGDPTTAGHVLTAGSGGTWSWAAPVTPGGLSFTPNPIPATYRGATNRMSIINIMSGGWTPAYTIFDGMLANQTHTGWSSNYFAWTWQNDTAYCINEITLYTGSMPNAGSTAVNNSNYYRHGYFQVWGSNNATTATNGTWVRLNEDNKWMDEAIANKQFYWPYNPGENYPDAWTFKLHKNMNNYKCYRIRSGNISWPSTSVYDLTFKYNKSHEADYS